MRKPGCARKKEGKKLCGAKEKSKKRKGKGKVKKKKKREKKMWGKITHAQGSLVVKDLKKKKKEPLTRKRSGEKNEGENMRGMT